MIWLANKTTAVNHELNLSLTFGFQVETSASKFTFQSKNKDLKATCPIKSGWIGIQENMFFSNMTITKTSKLAVETFLNFWAEFEMKNSCIYGSKRITRTGDNTGKTELLPLRAPERISDQAFNWSLEWWAFNCWGSGGYKTKTEDLRPKNEDPIIIVLKSLKKGSNVILDRSRNKEHKDLQLSTNLTRVFVLYITLPKVHNEDPVKIVLKSLEITRKRLEHDSRPKRKQGATRFAVINESNQGLRFVHNPTTSTKRRPWSNSLITANLYAPCFCFDRESCSSLF